MPADASAGRRRYRPAPVTLARGRVLPMGERTLLMGIINVTPDSFFPGSRSPRAVEAIERALELVDQGADIIDVGGESTRPASEPVVEPEEMDRVLPVIMGIRKASEVAISIDTSKSAVADAALAAGADIVNDVSGFTMDPAMPSLVADRGAIVVLMHSRGTPRTMQELAVYDDVVLQVKAELGARLAVAARSHVDPSRIWLDPGLGFAKTATHNLQLLERLDEMSVFEHPLVVGASRKSFIGRILGEIDPASRLEGSLATAAIAVLKGAHVLRVHDVAATRRAARVAEAIREPARLERLAQT